MIYDQAASYEVPVSKIVPNVYAEKYKHRTMGQITGVCHELIAEGTLSVYRRFDYQSDI
jgi:hypothetical protein